MRGSPGVAALSGKYGSINKAIPKAIWGVFLDVASEFPWQQFSVVIKPNIFDIILMYVLAGDISVSTYCQSP